MDMLATWVHVTISTAFVLVCILLILVILLQKGRGGGLSGAFGGGGGGHSAFGAKSGDVFTWVTVGLTFLFVLIAMIGNWKYVPVHPVVPTPPPAVPGAPGGEGVPGGAGATVPTQFTRVSGPGVELVDSGVQGSQSLST